MELNGIDVDAVEEGWYEEGGKRYYRLPNGNNAKNWFTAKDGQRCYAWPDGEIRAGFVDSNGYTYYVNDYGVKQTGYFTDGDGKRYYAHGFGGVEAKKGWFTADDGQRCYAWENGEIRAGFVASNGYTYYVNEYGVKQTGYFTDGDGKRYYAYGFGGVETKKGWFTADDGQRCYAWENGEIRVGFVVSNGYTYYVNEYGVKQTGYFTANDGKRYYAHGFGGVEAKGWFTTDEGQRCYAWENGEIRAGFVVSNGYTYYVNADGVKQTGYFTANDGKRYYAHSFGGVEVTQGWFTRDDGVRCYVWAGGEIHSGFVAFNGYNYYVNADGVKQTGYFNTPNGKRYYAYGFGGVETKQGWFTRDDGVRCYAWAGGEIGAGFVYTNGYYYYVNGDSVKQTGYFTAADGRRFYAHNFGGVETKQGWFTRDDGARCYAWANGEIGAGFVYTNGYYYYVNRDGVKQTGYFTAADGRRFYAYSFGGMVTAQGWFTRDDGVRCYAWAGGEIKADFLTMDGKIYFINEYGIKQTGYFRANTGKRYYADNSGVVVSAQGWFTRSDGVRCYAGPKGEINRSIYVFGAEACYTDWDGVPIKGHFKDDSGKWYLSDSTGVIKQGWIQRDGGSYYVGSDWALYTGTRVIDGVEYVFSAEGLFVPKKIPHTGVGIDVSSYQGSINWKQVAESGKVDFVIVRALHWDTAKKAYSIDPYFVQNVTAAKRYGLKVGAYLYSYAFNEAQFRQEIDFFLNSSEMKNLMATGFRFDLPVFIDYEDTKILENTTGVGRRTQDLLYGMTYLEQAARARGYGIIPGFYSMHEWANGKVFDGRYLQSLGYDFWLAQWRSSGHTWGDHPSIWQYSSNGYMPGINGRVDLNYTYKKYW